jgi:hypothetical protein
MKQIGARNLSAILPIAVLGAAIFASSAHAQVRGMGAHSSARTGIPFGGRRTGLSHTGHHRNFNDSGYLPSGYLYPYFPDYDYSDESAPPAAPPVQIVVAPPVQPPIPAPVPAQPLLLELRDGQWVRVATASEAPASLQPMQSDFAKAPNPQPNISSEKQPAQPLPASPRAVLVFRDGHQEELETYMIQGDLIYVGMDYWSSGSWTRTIPIAELDVPATLKLNRERGGKFSLPSGPSEIMIRF